MRRRAYAAPLAALSAALLGITLTPADAGTPAGTQVIGGLVTPLSVAVDTDGTVYVSQNFAGILTKQASGGSPETVFTAANGGEVGALSVAGGFLTFATTTGSETSHTGRLWQKDGSSAATMVLNTTKYEKANNPDSKYNYGFFRITKACRAKAPGMLGKYAGHVDSHPYGSAMAGGVTYLADAGGNDILSIAADGTPDTVAVLPPTKIRIDAAKQKAAGLPKCARGGTFRAEAVPTDVDVAPTGDLYVTSLPGGPEDGSLGANGRVYQVDPDTGTVTRQAGPGLVSPTGIAISPTGTAYISMLFAGVVMKVPYGGTPQVFANVPFPGDVDYANGKVYITRTDLMSDGTTPPDGAVLEFAP